MRGLTHEAECAGVAAPLDAIGMEQMREQLRAVHDARPRARVVRVGVHGEHAIITHRGELGDTRLTQ